jgi:predicted nucleotidyltransferase
MEKSKTENKHTSKENIFQKFDLEKTVKLVLKELPNLREILSNTVVSYLTITISTFHM